MKKVILSAICMVSLIGTIFAHSKKSMDAASMANNNPKNPVALTPYADRAAFEAAYPHTFVNEDFAGGPGAGVIQICGPVVSSAGDGCFSAGELEDGFSITASSENVTYAGVGAIGNASTLMGANLTSDFTVINFPAGVYAVGMDIFVGGVIDHHFRIYDTTGSLMIDYINSQPPNAESFFGAISDDTAIGRIEIEANDNSGEFFGNLEFGSEPLIIGISENELSGFAYYPNPVTNVLSLRSENKIMSVSFYNLFGQKLMENTVDASSSEVNLSALTMGIYLMKVSVEGQIGTYKILKN